MKTLLVCLGLFTLGICTSLGLATESRVGFRKVGVEESRAGVFVSYWLSEQPLSWTKAAQDCRDNFGILIAPLSVTVNLKLANMISDNELGNTTPIWTDGRYDAYASPVARWIWWTSKRAFGKDEPWSAGHPTLNSSTSCMAASGIGSAFGWKSFECNVPFLYICVNQD